MEVEGAVMVAARASSRAALDLHPARLLERRAAARLGSAICLIDAVDSTNALAMAAARAGAAAGALFIAEEQTKGRGRKDRQWHSVKGKSLTASILLRGAPVGEGITAVFGLAVVRALGRSVHGMALKWPNDIYVGGKKLGGILAESRGDAIVIGFGINVNEEAADFPAALADTAVSLRMAAGRRFDRGRVVLDVLESFEALLAEYERAGFALMRPHVEKHLLHIGKNVLIEDGAARYEGVVLGVTDEGYLRVDIGGEQRVFPSGDLTLREGSRGNDSRS
jgi:BirA family biotin operon repressor/biotin-[acetyl-CoA-carboxylase] ligase